MVFVLTRFISRFFCQNPFEGVGKEFCDTVPNEPPDEESEDLRARLDASLKYIKVKQFVAELFEYITLDLKGSASDHNIADWR